MSAAKHHIGPALVLPGVAEQKIRSWRSAVSEAAVWAHAAASIGACASRGAVRGAAVGVACAVPASVAVWIVGRLDTAYTDAEAMCLLARLLFLMVGVAAGWRIGFARGLVAGTLEHLADEDKLGAAVGRLWMDLLDRLVRRAAEAEDGRTVSLDMALETIGQLAHEHAVGEAFESKPNEVSKKTSNRVTWVVVGELLDACVEYLREISHHGRIDVRDLIELSLPQLDDTVKAKLRRYGRRQTLRTLAPAMALVVFPFALLWLVS